MCVYLKHKIVHIAMYCVYAATACSYSIAK